MPPAETCCGDSYTLPRFKIFTGLTGSQSVAQSEEAPGGPVAVSRSGLEAVLQGTHSLLREINSPNALLAGRFGVRLPQRRFAVPVRQTWPAWQTRKKEPPRRHELFVTILKSHPATTLPLKQAVVVDLVGLLQLATTGSVSFC